MEVITTCPLCGSEMEGTHGFNPVSRSVEIHLKCLRPTCKELQVIKVGDYPPDPTEDEALARAEEAETIARHAAACHENSVTGALAAAGERRSKITRLTKQLNEALALLRRIHSDPTADLVWADELAAFIERFTEKRCGSASTNKS